MPEYWIEPWSSIPPKNCVDWPIVNPDIFTFKNFSGLQFQIISQPGLLAGGAEDHLVGQLYHHLAGEGGVGGGGGEGGDAPIEFKDMIGAAALVDNCQHEQDKMFHFKSIARTKHCKD